MFSIIKKIKQLCLIINLKKQKGAIEMTDKIFMMADEVAEELGVSKAYAYKVIQQFNKELEAKGFFTLSGRVNRQYFLERTCYKPPVLKGADKDAGI